MSRYLRLPASVALVLVLVSAVSPPARAQGHRPTAKPERNQIEVFEDDPLDAVGLVERGSRVRARRGTGHSTLIRPRTHFIAELTQSVENL